MEMSSQVMGNLTTVLLVLAIVVGIPVIFFNMRRAKRGGNTSAEIMTAKETGKSVLYFRAEKLTLNGRDVSESPMIGLKLEKWIALNPGPYDSSGTFNIRDEEGNHIDTFTDAELSFTLKPGKEYLLGVFEFDPEIPSTSESFSMLVPHETYSFQGPSKNYAVVCVAC